MESVMQKIKQAREDDNRKRVDKNITETVVDGCTVKLRFSSVGDNKIIPAIKSMLISSRLDTVLTATTGGESV